MIQSFVGALIATYGVSRLSFRLLGSLRGLGRLAMAHLLSFFVLAIVIGFAKAYFTPFAVDETLVLILPQLIWFAVDSLRGKADR